MSSGSVRNVQFVSKAIAPPYRDGTKCLVRELCLHLQARSTGTEVRCHVLTAGGSLDELEGHAVAHPIYPSAGGYAPAALANLRAAAFLSLSRAADLWHFVFAPNPRSSQVGSLLCRLRRVPTVQTIASPPREFQRPERLLFGDRVVAQSHWTRTQFEQAYRAAGQVPPRIEVIFPPAPRVLPVAAGVVEGQLRELGLTGDAPLFLYPGDLETSSGARMSVEIAAELATSLPGAQVVLAYRHKTSRAEETARQLRARTNPARVKIVPDVTNIAALIQASTAVIFPVDDLFGKVDLPIVLLEALRLGTPVFALDQGPLQDLRGARLLPCSIEAWVRALLQLARGENLRRELVEGGWRAVAEHFEPETVAARYLDLYRSLW